MKEFRIRYELETAMGNKVIHAVVCKPEKLNSSLDLVAKVGYRLVGIDRRMLDDGEPKAWDVLKEYT